MSESSGFEGSQDDLPNEQPIQQHNQISQGITVKDFRTEFQGKFIDEKDIPKKAQYLHDILLFILQNFTDFKPDQLNKVFNFTEANKKNMFAPYKQLLRQNMITVFWLAQLCIRNVKASQYFVEQMDGFLVLRAFLSTDSNISASLRPPKHADTLYYFLSEVLQELKPRFLTKYQDKFADSKLGAFLNFFARFPQHSVLRSDIRSIAKIIIKIWIKQIENKQETDPTVQLEDSEAQDVSMGRNQISTYKYHGGQDNILTAHGKVLKIQENATSGQDLMLQTSQLGKSQKAFK